MGRGELLIEQVRLPETLDGGASEECPVIGVENNLRKGEGDPDLGNAKDDLLSGLFTSLDLIERVFGEDEDFEGVMILGLGMVTTIEPSKLLYG